MSLTFTSISSAVIGNRREVVQDILLDSSYPTGGYPLSATQLGCDIKLDSVNVQQGVGGLIFQYDYTNSKLKAYLPTGGGGTGTAGAPTISAPTISTPTASAPVATLANAVVPSGVTGVTSSAAQPALTITQPTISAPTISTPTSSAPALNPGIAAEVPNTTDLHTVKVRVTALGKGTANLIP